MFNEAIRVAGITGDSAKLDFYHRKWTYSSCQFNESSPAGSRYVSQCNPGRAKCDEAAKNDESDKQEVENKNGICQESIDHEDVEVFLIYRQSCYWVSQFLAAILALLGRYCPVGAPLGEHPSPQTRLLGMMRFNLPRYQ